MWKKLRGGFVAGLGYMLSPLSWWNDLFFNLPIAYGFGYAVSLIRSDLFLPATVVGYWLSNVLGMVLMQMGATDLLFTDRPIYSRYTWLVGLGGSTLYTVVIVGLVYFRLVDLSDLFPVL